MSYPSFFIKTRIEGYRGSSNPIVSPRFPLICPETLSMICTLKSWQNGRDRLTSKRCNTIMTTTLLEPLESHYGTHYRVQMNVPYWSEVQNHCIQEFTSLPVYNPISASGISEMICVDKAYHKRTRSLLCCLGFFLVRLDSVRFNMIFHIPVQRIV